MIDIFGDKPLFMPSTNHSFGHNKLLYSYRVNNEWLGKEEEHPSNTITAAALCTTNPIGNWNSSDKEWEEDTWEYLLTQDDNLLESLWALLQDIRDPGVTNKVD
ncbi:uncharacterized protein FIBRA_09615 [Fibroporia radiculosa]|uniref:Uncharacterized protein n=1 Tax=Fibroporia radiculosa TaxID=599839 RepID=J7RI64_9APHY|nr:uncharacterized protein FIBRA_09615 [Fibroporia radiculosa]CCM07267.1 predicted protein [Fibroporia radiculosa]